MLWNWYTIDACFLSASWHVTSNAIFAGSCIGTILLVISLEFLRRTAKEYDRHILRQFQRSLYLPTESDSKGCPPTKELLGGVGEIQFRPNILQQIVRATLHMVQFAVAYFVMLLAMTYNGYIIICIIIGAWIGGFAFTWESISIG
jgi:copper transporter 1